jgi:folate-binding Fe-S cluster repair protein YgfZ
MATFVGRRFFAGQFLKRIFRAKRHTRTYICTKHDKEFTSVLLNNRGHIEVFGEDSVQFLQGLLTNDVNLFHCDSQMTALYSMMLNTKGRVLYDLILYKQERETPRFLIECDLHAVESIMKTFKPYKLRSKVAFDDATDKFNSWAVMEEGSIAGLKQTDKDSNFVTLAEDPRIELLGTRMVLPKNTGAAECFINVTEIGDQAVYDRHRVGLGVAEGVKDLEPGKLLPLECNIAELHGGLYWGLEEEEGRGRNVDRIVTVTLCWLD